MGCNRDGTRKRGGSEGVLLSAVKSGIKEKGKKKKVIGFVICSLGDGLRNTGRSIFIINIPSPISNHSHPMPRERGVSFTSFGLKKVVSVLFVRGVSIVAKI